MQLKRKGIKQSAGVGIEPRAISPEAGEENEVKSHHHVKTQPQNFKAQRKTCWWSLQARLKSICARRGSSERLGGFPCLFLQLQLMGGGETGFPDHKPQLGDKSGLAVSPLPPPPGSISHTPSLAGNGITLEGAVPSEQDSQPKPAKRARTSFTAEQLQVGRDPGDGEDANYWGGGLNIFLPSPPM